MQTLNCILLDS